MDLYNLLPINHPLRLSLPEDAAKVAVGYCNLTPYRIILWKRLLNFLLTNGSLAQEGYDRLKLTLPADEDALKAWTYYMVNYAATVPGGADDFKEIVIKVENPTPSEKDDIDKWSPADIVNTVIGVSVIGGTIGAVSLIVYKIRTLELGRNLILNNLGDIGRWMTTTQEGMSGMASALAALSAGAGPNVALGAGLNVPVVVNVLNRGPNPGDVPEVVHGLNAAFSTPTAEMAAVWDVYQATGSMPASLAAGAVTNGVRRLGGVSNIYRRTSMMARSAHNSASSMRGTIVNGWNRMTGRSVQESDLDPLEREYHLMDDVDAEPLSEFLRDGEASIAREKAMTRYDMTRHEERPSKRSKPNDEFKYGDEEMPELVDETAVPKVNDVVQNSVINNEPYYELPESSYAITESTYAPLAEEMDMVEMSSWATSSMTPLGETPAQAAARRAQTRAELDDMEQKMHSKFQEQDARQEAEQKGYERDQTFDRNASEQKMQQMQESIDQEQKSLAQQLKDIQQKFSADRKAAVEKANAAKAEGYQPLPAEEPPSILTAADAADLGVGAAAGAEAGADAALAGADAAVAAGDGASAALTAFRSFMVVAAPVIDVAGTVLNVLGVIAMLAQIGFAIYEAIEDPIIRRKMQATLEAAEKTYHDKLQTLVDKAGITLPSHTYTYRSHQSPGYIWSKPSTNAVATTPWLYDYPQPCMQYIQSRLDHPEIVSPSILEGVLHMREIYNSWIPTTVLRSYPEYSGLENVNLFDFHMTLYDLVDYHLKDDYVRYDIHGNDARVNFLGSYIKNFEYVLKMIVAKNWKPMLAEMDKYLLTHKSLAKSGEVTLSSVMMRYIVHPSYLQEPTKNSMVQRRYDYLKAVMSMFGDVMINLTEHEFSTYSNTHDPAVHVTSKNTSLLFSDHGKPPVHKTLHRYGQTIPINDTILTNFKLPYVASESQFPDLADVMDFTFKVSTLFAYESYQTVQGVSIAFGYDPVSKDEFCVMGLGTASSVLCGRLDGRNIVYVTEYQANNDFQTRSESLTPICDAEKTFLKNTTTPITVDEISVRTSRYIVSMDGIHMDVKEMDKNRAFQVNVTNNKIDFIALINETRQCFSATGTTRSTPAATRYTPQPTLVHADPPPPKNLTPAMAPPVRRRRHKTTTKEVYDALLISTVSPKTGFYHISSYEDYDMIMGQVVSKLKILEAPAWMDSEYDVGDENDDLDYAIGEDGVVRAYYLGRDTVKVIQMINVKKPDRKYRYVSTTEDGPSWTPALVAIKFTRIDLLGGTIRVDGKIIDAYLNKVIGSFNMNIDRGTMYNIMSGLAWTFDSVVAGAAVGLDGASTVIVGAGVVGSAVGSGLGTVGSAVGSGLGTVGSAIGNGAGAVIGGTANLVGDAAYNMAVRAFYDSGYIQAATAIGIVLVVIDLKKNKII